MNNLDLRQIGTVIGLPVYVDVSSVRDYRAENEIMSERDKKAMMASVILKRAFELSDEQIDRIVKARTKELLGDKPEQRNSAVISPDEFNPNGIYGGDNDW